jgi:hypothetical protein
MRSAAGMLLWGDIPAYPSRPLDDVDRDDVYKEDDVVEYLSYEAEPYNSHNDQLCWMGWKNRDGVTVTHAAALTK